MDKENLIEKGKKVLERIVAANKILIVSDGSRVDYDCIGTAIALKKFLHKLGKTEVKSYIFARIPQYLGDFDNIKEEVITKYLKEVDFNYYDLVFLVDTNDWDRVLTREYAKVLENTDITKFINIDHHIDGTIMKDIPDNVINFRDVCAGKVLYDYLIKPSGIEMDFEIANPLYLSLVGDSGIFKYIKDDTFQFAQLLLDNGVNHNKVINLITDISKEIIEYFSTAVENTHYYEDIKLTVFTITEDLYNTFTKKFENKWIEDDYAEFYKDTFEAKITGYDYGIIFRHDPNSKGTRLSWRTRGADDTIEILPILLELGFKAGGHRNAGGGFASVGPEEAEKKFVEAMKQVVSSK